MMEFLYHYGLFLAKTLTLVLGIIITFSAIVAIALKSKMKVDEGTLVINPINEKLDEIRDYMQTETLSKQALKKWHKAQKAKEKNEKKEKEENKRLFVARFEGDIRASEVEELREVITAIIEVASPSDEVLIILDSSGGFVHSYGLAASQLDRLRQKNLHVTAAIDKVAASGGYLMACVANRIIAAPFAIVGSIGVVAQLPNFHRLLEKHNIDYELHTAGEFKRTLTMFGENTAKAREKFQEEIEQTHGLFKDYITHHRAQVDINQVATGEHWHALQAIDLKLIDDIQTSDDFIVNKAKTMQLFEVSFEVKQKLADKIANGLSLFVDKFLLKWFQKSQKSYV